MVVAFWILDYRSRLTVLNGKNFLSKMKEDVMNKKLAIFSGRNMSVDGGQMFRMCE